MAHLQALLKDTELGQTVHALKCSRWLKFQHVLMQGMLSLLPHHLQLALSSCSLLMKQRKACTNVGPQGPSFKSPADGSDRGYERY